MHELAKFIDADVASVLELVDLSPLDGRSVLITGASGLLGTYLLACLRRRMRLTGIPIDVIAVSKSPVTGVVADLLDGRYIRSLQVDLADYKQVSDLPVSEFIIHAAGYGQPGKFLEDPIATIRINTTATIQLLDKLSKGGRFLYLSSSEVYSGSTNIPHREEDIGTTDPAHPRACYIEGKRCGEAICNTYRGLGIEARSARLALAYGPGTRPDDQRVLNSFIRRAFLDQKISLIDEGLAQRTYGYITDVTEFLFSILLYGRANVYNVGGISNVSIFELAQLIGSEIGIPVIAPRQGPNLLGAPSNVALDLARASNEFGKKNFVTLIDGLHRTIAWQRNLFDVA